MRTVEQFADAIEKSLKSDPTKPVRFDVTRREFALIEKAFWKKDWRCAYGLHCHPEKKELNVFRAVFFGPKCKKPKTKKALLMACYSVDEMESIWIATANFRRWKENGTLRSLTQKEIMIANRKIESGV